MTSYTIPIDVTVTDEVAVAETSGPSYGYNGSVLAGAVPTGRGWAKKHPNDRPNQVVGFNLAIARALQELADVYASRAAKEVGASIVVGGYEYAPPPTKGAPFTLSFTSDSPTTYNNVINAINYTTDGYSYGSR